MRTGRPPKYPQTIAAQAVFQKLGIPYEAYQAFCSQVQVSHVRGISFEFTIKDWWAWWQTDNRWASRGVGKGKLVMARIGDKGPYRLDNVFCCTHEANIRLIDTSGLGEKLKRSWRQRSSKPGFKWHLAVCGDGHPCSKAVIAPDGRRYGSAREAARLIGIDPSTVQRWARRKHNGWGYEQL